MTRTKDGEDVAGDLVDTVGVTQRDTEERRLRFVTDALPALVAYVDLDGRYKFVNRAYAQWFGIPAPELIGRHVRDVLGSDTYDQIGAQIAAVLAGETVTFEIQVPHRDNELRHVRAVYTPDLDPDSPAKVRGYASMIIDTTDDRDKAAQLAALSEAVGQRETAYRRLAESLPDVIARYDRENRHTYVNPAAVRATGMPIESFIGKSNRDLQMPEHLVVRWEAALADAFEGRASRVDYDYPSPSGTLSFETQFVPERDAGGEVTSVLAVSHEVTDARRALAHAESMRAQLQDANHAKDAFLAMLGHELRNPLAPIVTTVQLMKLREPDTLVRERSTIERQVEHMVRLVDDLLDVSRITQSKLELRRRALDLNEIVRKALDQASPLLTQRDHRITTNLTNEPIIVDGDETRLAQVFANLLQNAAKYTPKSGKIHIGSRREGDQAVVEVSDTGIGIDASLLPNIFALFVQSERAIDRREGGLGLGLAIVRNLVELHGGTVRAESTGPGKGSVFTMTLPVLSAAPRGDVRHEDATVPTTRPAGVRVLIVDDNRDAADMLAEMLSVLGHETVVAYDGAEALHQFERFRPDVSLVDIGLPVIDGYEVARRICALQPQNGALLVALTGYGQDKDRERALQAGFVDHLVKPVDIKRVARIIDERFPR